jgi:hypothetical protein
MLNVRLPEFLNELETIVLRFLLREDTADNRVIVEQLATCSLESREHNGYGIYMNLQVSNKAPRCPTDDFELDDISAIVGGQLCGFILFVRDGKAAFLEGFPLGGDAWPKSEIIEKVGRFHNVDSVD